MALPRFPCKNHPQKTTTRKCFHCHEFICSDCHIIHDHHIFCSRTCIRKYDLGKYYQWIFNYRKQILTISAFLVLQLLFYLLINHRIDNLADVAADKSVADTLQPAVAITVDTTITVNPELIQLKGSAPPNTLLGLWQNGEFVATSVAGKEGYRFKPQALNLGENKFILWSLNENGKSALVDSFSLTYYSLRYEQLRKPVARIRTAKKRVSLTFDAGSISTGADSIINILKNNKLKTTFFLTGQFIRHYPEIVKRLVRDGHEIANHTWSHPHFTNYSGSGVQHKLPNISKSVLSRQLRLTDSLFNVQTGKRMVPLWRAPFGEFDRQILDWAAEAGYKHIGWSAGCDTWDWVSDTTSNLYRTPSEMLDKLMNRDLRGAIVLMHLGTDRKTQPGYEMLNELIRELQAKNYQILPVSKLLTKPL